MVVSNSKYESVSNSLLREFYDLNDSVVQLSPREIRECDLPLVRDMSEEEWLAFRNDLSKGAIWMGNHARQWGNYELSLKQLCDRLMAYREIYPCLSLDQDQWNLPLQPKALTNALLRLGIGYKHQALKFIELYNKFGTKGRSFGSCYQPVQAIAIIARNTEYWCLPDHVLRDLIHSGAWLPDRFRCGDRIGDIWQYKHAAKAWKICPNLPKKIAVRIGKMELWKRYAAAKAWATTTADIRCFDNDHFTCQVRTIRDLALSNWHTISREGWGHDAELYGQPCDRSQLINTFWYLFNKECQKGKSAIIANLLDSDPESCYPNPKPHNYRVVEGLLNLPQKFLSGKETFIEVAKYLDPKQALVELFGVSSKSLLRSWDKAIKSSNASVIQWAAHLAPKGNIDWINKYLSLEFTIPFYKECVDFLKSLHPSRALAMIQVTTYKHHGENHSLQEFHYKDTGMLYSNLIQRNVTPFLRRVRCWLTVHEELGRQYVAILPNEPVNIPVNWKRVNGLCSVKRDWRIELPTSTAELKYWGEQLHNCVGGYGDAINRGACVVFVVYWEGSLKYCVEIRNKSVAQFSGQRNSYADRHEQESVVLALQDAGLIS